MIKKIAMNPKIVKLAVHANTSYVHAVNAIVKMNHVHASNAIVKTSHVIQTIKTNKNLAIALTSTIRHHRTSQNLFFCVRPFVIIEISSWHR